MPMQVTREIDNNLTFEEEEEKKNDTQKYNVRVKFTWILQQCPTIYISTFLSRGFCHGTFFFLVKYIVISFVLN